MNNGLRIGKRIVAGLLASGMTAGLFAASAWVGDRAGTFLREPLHFLRALEDRAAASRLASKHAAAPDHTVQD